MEKVLLSVLNAFDSLAAAEVALLLKKMHDSLAEKVSWIQHSPENLQKVYSLD